MGNIGKAFFRISLLSLCFSLSGLNSFAGTDSIRFQYLSEFRYSFLYSAYTTLFDDAGRPYIYAASNELGVIVFDISDVFDPVPVDTIRKQDVNGLNVTNIYQHGDYLYASLGGFQGAPQSAGLAIINISDPQHLSLTAVWDSSAFDQGCAIAISDGQYAYLGAMEHGLIILDVQQKNDIRFVSNLVPDPDFPEPPTLFAQPNARGMVVRNDRLYLCNDSKGFRMIDVSDKQNPVEIGKYMNIALDDTAQPAYNNVVIIDNYAYVAVDYCGMDVIDITDPAMETVYWWDPWACDSINWFGRPGHTNQLVSIGDSVLMLSGGDSEVLALDISDREMPTLIGAYAFTGDSSATWGLDVFGDKVVLAQVNNSVFQQPYYSDWGGIQLLQWESVITGDQSYDAETGSLEVSPNPASDNLVLSFNLEQAADVAIDIFNAWGGRISRITAGRFGPGHNRITHNIKDLPAGLYLVKFSGNEIRTAKLVKP